MRVTADVYDSNGIKTGTGPVLAIKSASVTEQLDGAGTFSLDLAVDERVLTLINETEVRVNVQTYDAQPSMEWARGIVRDNEIQDAEGGTQITVSGPDTMDALTERTVGIGRSYDNQTMSTILNSLVGLVPGWSTSIESAVASDLQSTRFDGANVLQALLRCTNEKGIHVRNGLTPNTLEIGAFGSAVVNSNGVAVRAIKAPSEPNIELQRNDTVILIDRISRSSKSDDVVNWCIPIGAGEGSAALTLKDTTYAIYYEDGTLYRAGTASKYPIYRRVNDNNIVEYYINASGGARLRQATITFKEIGPIANADNAKQLAANALAQAAMAFLDRQKVALVTYRFSAKNVQVRIRPGDMLPVEYQGRMEIIDEERTRSSTPRLTYMEVDQSFWVLKVTKRISADVITHDFEAATVDRYAMDTSKIVVSMMEAMQARNLSVQTIPYWSKDSWTDFVGLNRFSLAARPARFPLEIDELVTDIIRVNFRFRTRPLFSTIAVPPNAIAAPNDGVVYELDEGDQHPKDLQMFINGVDVSAAFGGPWNTRISGTPGLGWTVGQYQNNALNVSGVITPYILNAAGGIYQEHIIEFKAQGDPNAYSYVMGNYSASSYVGDARTGIIEFSVRIFGTARGVIPAPA